MENSREESVCRLGVVEILRPILLHLQLCTFALVPTHTSDVSVAAA
jgi:hypothetical protein